MPLYIKVDFRADGKLGAWWSRNEPHTWDVPKMNTTVAETRVRNVLTVLADEIDPLKLEESKEQS